MKTIVSLNDVCCFCLNHSLSQKLKLICLNNDVSDGDIDLYFRLYKKRCLIKTLIYSFVLLTSPWSKREKENLKI